MTLSSHFTPLSLLHRQHRGEYKPAQWNQTGEPEPLCSAAVMNTFHQRVGQNAKALIGLQVVTYFSQAASGNLVD